MPEGRLPGEVLARRRPGTCCRESIYPVIPRAAGEVAGERNCLGLPTEKLIEMVVERINQSVVAVVTASPLSLRSSFLCFHVSPEKW